MSEAIKTIPFYKRVVTIHTVLFITLCCSIRYATYRLGDHLGSTPTQIGSLVASLSCRITYDGLNQKIYFNFSFLYLYIYKNKFEHNVQFWSGQQYLISLPNQTIFTNEINNCFFLVSSHSNKYSSFKNTNF